MIPADQIIIDGDTALVVYDDDHPLHFFRLADRLCDTCGGQPTWTDSDDGDWFACPDCIDGRHAFDIEVEYHEHGYTGTHTLRVHVIDVLPIVVVLPAADRERGARQFNSDHDRITMHPMAGECYLWTNGNGTPITLPPDAAPGMWLVRLAVHR